MARAPHFAVFVAVLLASAGIAAGTAELLAVEHNTVKYPAGPAEGVVEVSVRYKCTGTGRTVEPGSFDLTWEAGRDPETVPVECRPPVIRADGLLHGYAPQRTMALMQKVLHPRERAQGTLLTPSRPRRYVGS